jgi:hypothetical protein
MLSTIEAEATLENCRALINQITVGLSAEKPFVGFLSAAVRPWKANGRSSAQAAAAAIGTPYGLFVPDVP